MKTLRLLADPTRLRILHLLSREELSVAELQAILAMGQSRISSQLAQLKQAGFLTGRRSGKHILYAAAQPRAADRERWEQRRALVESAVSEIPEGEDDLRALELILEKRQDLARRYFDELAGKFGRHYCPGRSWKGLAETLLKIMPPLVVADLGAGEGTFSQLLAQRAERVIAVDNSRKMVEFGADLARRHGFANLEYRFGDMMDPPIEDSSVDLAFFSQALHHAARPQRAIDSALRILKPGGRIVILDLLTHQFEQARELYADLWLGFSELEIRQFLRRAGFEKPETSVVHREEQSPHFQTLLAIATKPVRNGGKDEVPAG
ncbi:MAG TPA: metalloregulator ArsR/SmtB family transcription factor [Verrucomicrobiales bacterium]|nr:metalloregulator ArsR/SmtB family transcription factor [Verrucomicrobiales bacterium]